MFFSSKIIIIKVLNDSKQLRREEKKPQCPTFLFTWLGHGKVVKGWPKEGQR
jgi:hypothetical protein